MKGVHGPTKLLHALTWGAFDHTSHAPQGHVTITCMSLSVHVYIHIQLPYHQCLTALNISGACTNLATKNKAANDSMSYPRSNNP